jgi:hypothetical protein
MVVGNEYVLIVGFAFTSALFAYYSFDFMASQEYFTKLMGQGFFSLSMLFLLLITNLCYLLSVNDTSLVYLKDSVVLIAFTVIYYSLIIGICLYILSLIVGALKMLVDAAKVKFGGRKRSTEPKEAA